MRVQLCGKGNRSAVGALGVAVAVVVLATGLLASPPAPRPPLARGHHLSKRSFFDIQCKGVYDKSIFARLDRICEDCYNLFREPQLHTLCRSQCFTTDYFGGCLESLLLQEEEEKFKQMIEFLGKRK